MRRSFGGSGGGGGGGGMVKALHRAVRTGMGGGSGAPPEPYSYNTITTTNAAANNRNNQPLNTSLSVSSNPTSPRSYVNQPVPAAEPSNWDFTTYSAGGDGVGDWECVEGSLSYEDLLYGSVPSKEEVNHAVSSLQEVLEPVSFAQLIKEHKTHGSTGDDRINKILNPTSSYRPGSELDWIEPSLQLCNSTSSLLVPTRDKVYDAFHLLQTEPSVQRMVISLSSDKAVWEAVMNNEVVRELRESVEDKSISRGSDESEDDLNPVTQVLGWIFINTKEKVIEIIDKITKFVNELAQPMNKDKNPKKNENVELNSFEEKLKSSFFLSIMVLLIVVVSRSRNC